MTWEPTFEFRPDYIAENTGRTVKLLQGNQEGTPTWDEGRKTFIAYDAIRECEAAIVYCSECKAYDEGCFYDEQPAKICDCEDIKPCFDCGTPVCEQHRHHTWQGYECRNCAAAPK